MSTAKSTRKYLWLLPLLLLTLAGGCWLFSGTWVIIYVADDEDIHATEDFYRFTVDITDEEIWKDHHDDLDNIEDISITFKVVNPLLTPATGQVYVSSDDALSDSAAVVSSATLILDGFTIPAEDSLEFMMADYYDLLQNFEALRDLVKTGVFTGYAIVPEPLGMEFKNVVVIVTFSAGM
jgi:hypothetical protein